MGGECDGHTVMISHGDRPEVFYAVPLLDNEKIRATKGKEAKLAVRDRLAILAYEYRDDGEHRTEDGSLEFRYYRCPEKDKGVSPSL
jgi:hypothetical protein